MCLYLADMIHHQTFWNNIMVYNAIQYNNG